MLKLTFGESGCCGDTATTCEYTVTYTQTRTISLLNTTVDGVAEALACVPASTSAADVEAAILATLLANGYEDDSNPDFPGVSVVDDGSTLTVTIIGTVVPVSLTTSGGTETFTSDCTLVNQCTYSTDGYAGGTSATAATNLHINGVDHNLGTITAGTTSAADVETAIEGAIAASDATGTVTVTTTGTGESQTYNITITASEFTNTFVLAGVYLDRSDCAPVFV